jgi:hypothetical protein
MTIKFSREDQIAANLARLGGVALSQDDLEALDMDDDTGDTPKPPADGKMSMEKLLADLLAALGIHLPANTDEADFKRSLCAACMEKVKELTGGKGKGASSQQASGNPLIPGGGGADTAPIYMSLALDNLRLQNESLKMRKFASDMEVAACIPADCSPQRADEIAAMMAAKMGYAEHGGAALSTESAAAQDFITLVAKHGR